MQATEAWRRKTAETMKQQQQRAQRRAAEASRLVTAARMTHARSTSTISVALPVAIEAGRDRAPAEVAAAASSVNLSNSTAHLPPAGSTAAAAAAAGLQQPPRGRLSRFRAQDLPSGCGLPLPPAAVALLSRVPLPLTEPAPGSSERDRRQHAARLSVYEDKLGEYARWLLAQLDLEDTRAAEVVAPVQGPQGQ
jgi:hypothetical protein